MVRRCHFAISASKLNLTVNSTKNTGGSKKVHSRVRDSFLDKLHVENRLTISDQRAIDGKIKISNQTAESPRVRAKLFALRGHVRHTNSRAEAVLSGCPRFTNSIARWLHHRVVNFLELHPRPAHPDQRYEGSQYFVCAFADLIDSRVSQHSFQWQIGEVSRAAINLKYVVDAFPEPFCREHFQHCSLKHVILKASVDERRGHRGHRFHRVSVSRDPGNFLFHQLKFAQCFVELPS